MAPKKPAGKAGRKPQGAKESTPRKPAKANGGYERSDSRRGGQQSGFQRSGRSGGDRGKKLNIRTGEDVSILEGRHAFEEAMETGAIIEAIYIADTMGVDDPIMRLVFQAKKSGAKLCTVDSAELDAYSSHGAHQGIIAQLKPYRYAALKDLIDAAAGKENALIVATDHVTDAGNFGAIVRSTEVVGGCGVLIPNKRNARVNTAAYKTSAGAVMHLPIAMEANLARSLETLKEEGFWIVGASEHAEDVIWDAPLSGRVVLVMGSEGDGLSRLTMDACDLLVKLPQAGKVESLNVAQATTAIAYEWARQSRNA